MSVIVLTLALAMLVSPRVAIDSPDLVLHNAIGESPYSSATVTGRRKRDKKDGSPFRRSSSRGSLEKKKPVGEEEEGGSSSPFHLIDEDDVVKVCLDFDKTITNTHSGGGRLQTWLDDNGGQNIIDDIRDPEYFKRLVYTLLNNGHKLCIATFSDVEYARKGEVAGCALVRMYLDKIFGGPAERQRVFPDSYMECYMPENHNEIGKNQHLINIAERNSGRLRAGDMLLIDDSGRNIELAAQQGHHAIHAPDGFTWKDIHEKILEDAELNKKLGLPKELQPLEELAPPSSSYLGVIGHYTGGMMSAARNSEYWNYVPSFGWGGKK